MSERLLQVAIALVAAAFLLQWAWRMLAPLVPVVMIGVIAWAVVRLVQERRRNW